MTGRALLTAAEREVLAGTRGDDEYRATVRSRVRNRLDDLQVDVNVFETEAPDLLTEIREIVC